MTQSSLTQISDGLWTSDGLTRFAPGAHIQGRMTIVRLSDHSLLIHSPIKMNEELVREITELGQVSALFAPNLYHHMFLREAATRFTEAKVFGPSGLARKVRSVSLDGELRDELPLNLRADFESVFIEGAPTFNEIVLHHSASNTLIVGDYFFNVHKFKGLLAKPLLRMTDSLQKPTQSKLWRRVTKNRELMQKSAERVLDLDYQRVVMCHGEVVEQGRDFTSAALQWVL